MNREAPDIILSTDDDGQPIVMLEESRVETLSELFQATSRKELPEQLDWYCEALNHLKYGYEYQLILDADAYRADYEERLKSEDPDEPFQEGVVRLRNFGVCDTSEIQAPRIEDELLIFYVKDNYLGIPYRVTAPRPSGPEGEVQYDPLPMSPLRD